MEIPAHGSITQLNSLIREQCPHVIYLSILGYLATSFLADIKLPIQHGDLNSTYPAQVLLSQTSFCSPHVHDYQFVYDPGQVQIMRL